MVNNNIFREYDIRGIAERDLTSPVIEALGEAFAAYLRPKGIVTATVGYDARTSSPRLCDDIVRGLTKGSVRVTILGLCPTPALYYSLYHLNAGAGIMITGSHNPAEFNGFKLCVGKETIFGEEIQAIRRIMESGVRSQESGEKGAGTAKNGTVAHSPILPDYINHLKRLFNVPQKSRLKIAIDSGNGTAGLAAPEILRSMHCEVIELFSEPDGRFPNHHPDPTIPENLTA
jgi:phosphomannomutase/phosphoglucomutase